MGARVFTDRLVHHQVSVSSSCRRIGLQTASARAGDYQMPERTKAGLGCQTFRATGITVHLLDGELLEYAQQMAAHESAARPRSAAAATTWSCSSRVMMPAFRARRTIIRRAP